MSFIKHNVYLTDFQLNKLRLAAKKKEQVHLDINPNNKPNFELYLTQRQITKLNKGKTARINLSKSQLVKNGGFIFTIPTILAGIGALAGVTSAASAVAKAVNAKKHENRTELEQKRHNAEMEKLLSKKTGLGPYLPKSIDKKSGQGCKVKKNSTKSKKKA